MGTQIPKKVPMGTRVPKWGPIGEQCFRRAALKFKLKQENIVDSPRNELVNAECLIQCMMRWQLQSANKDSTYSMSRDQQNTDH